jgi:hypothetical protein
LYDRSPIVVTPNSCALPERGCPGRTYTLDDSGPQLPTSNWRSGAHNGRHLHPRAVATAYRVSSSEDEDSEDNDVQQRPPSRTFFVPPPLIPDLSSESDESDGPTSSLPGPAQYSMPSSYHHPPHSTPIVAPSHPPIPHTPYLPYSSSDNQAYFTGSPNALSFLPHPVSPKDESQKARRRKQRDQPRSRGEGQGGRRAADGSYKSLSVCKALSNCSLDESEAGCLDGF